MIIEASPQDKYNSFQNQFLTQKAVAFFLFFAGVIKWIQMTHDW